MLHSGKQEALPTFWDALLQIQNHLVFCKLYILLILYCIFIISHTLQIRASVHEILAKKTPHTLIQDKAVPVTNM